MEKNNDVSRKKTRRTLSMPVTRERMAKPRWVPPDGAASERGEKRTDGPDLGQMGAVRGRSMRPSGPFQHSHRGGETGEKTSSSPVLHPPCSGDLRAPGRPDRAGQGEEGVGGVACVRGGPSEMGTHHNI